MRIINNSGKIISELLSSQFLGQIDVTPLTGQLKTEFNKQTEKIISFKSRI